MRVYCHDRYDLGLPHGHRFPATKYPLLRQRMADVAGVRLAEAPAADDDALALVHAPAYVAAIVAGTLPAEQQRAIGLPWSPGLVERSRRSVGATIAAARDAAAEGVAAQLGGGTHHAGVDRGAGYCVFNDVAVAARVLQREAASRGEALRLWVIDLDVHQGDGTAAIFRDDPSVFTLSLHGARNFPFRKQASDLDVELADGCGDAEYLAALDAALETSWARQRDAAPRLAFYLAGADPHEGDRLGRLRLTGEGLAERDRRVFALLHRLRVPVAVVMAGGYGNDIATTVDVHLRTMLLARDAWRRWSGPALR